MRPVLKAFWQSDASTRKFGDALSSSELERSIRLAAAPLVW